MVDLTHGLRADAVRANLERIRGQIETAGRDPEDVEVLAAIKYVPVEELPVLAEAGVTLVGEKILRIAEYLDTAQTVGFDNSRLSS